MTGILRIAIVIALAQANKLRPAPIVPNPLLCRAVSFPSQPHSSHPSLLSFLEKEHIRSQNVRSCDRMFPFDVKHITVLLFCQANFRPIRYIHHFRQFRSTSFVQNSKHMFAYEKERNAQGNQQYSTGVFFAGRGLLTATS